LLVKLTWPLISPSHHAAAAGGGAAAAADSDLDFALTGWVEVAEPLPGNDVNDSSTGHQLSRLELHEWDPLEQQYLLTDLADALEDKGVVLGQVTVHLHTCSLSRQLFSITTAERFRVGVSNGLGHPPTLRIGTAAAVAAVAAAAAVVVAGATRGQ